MSTYMQDLKRDDPVHYADVALVGDQPTQMLKNMIRALSIMPMMNSAEENARLSAAKRVLKRRRTAR